MNADEKIWRYLKSAGLNDFGVAGLMGNLFAESGLNPKNLQNTYEKKLGMTDEEYTAAVDSGSYSNFVKDSAGYGLAQWTYWSRKDALLASCKAAGASVGDMDAQLNFLLKELSVGYSGLLSTLKSAPSVREASNAVLLQFERPANQGQSVQEKRASYGQAYYDKFAGKIQINTPEQEGGCKLKIVDNLTTVNFRSGNMTPKYIVIHYFGALGTAKSVSEYFKTPGIQASTHYALDEGDTIYRCVRDKDIAWHCGANKYKHPECRNSNSIGIEARPSKINRKRVMASDTDWYFEPKVVDNLVWLTKKLMAQYNIPADHVIRHYDVTGKLCPRPWCCADMNVYYKTSGDAQWEEFKKRISDGKEEDEDMTLDTFKELMKEYRAELQDNDCGTWSKEAREWAISNGLINGTGTEVNGEPNYAWADQLTREQAAALFYRFAKLMGKA